LAFATSFVKDADIETKREFLAFVRPEQDVRVGAGPDGTRVVGVNG
jgi:hypothetical protein